MNFGYTLSGLLIGSIVGMTGVGGGSLMTPLLVLVFGIQPSIAVGTDLLYAAITKAGGAWVHGRQGHVEWNIVGLLSLGSIPAAILSVLVLNGLAIDRQVLSSLISTTLGIALILTSVALLYRDRIRKLGGMSGEKVKFATVAAGAMLGMLVTMSSVGAGALGTVVLFFLYPRLSPISVVGTDIAHAVPLTAIAGLGHAALGTVDFHLLGSLLLGSLPGIYFGSMLGSRIPEKMLRGALAGMLILIGGKLMF
ncbi:MAG: sulfite exporter TauE/SafE family protein [Burkholderiales bacterium]|nr:sulfite exporter TauE/SafE family protein [Burkholderiales bacterium]